MYPLGAGTMEIPVRASLRLPAGWQHDTALVPDSGGEAGKDGLLTFAAVALRDADRLAGAGGRLPSHNGCIAQGNAAPGLQVAGDGAGGDRLRRRHRRDRCRQRRGRCSARATTALTTSC